MYVTSIWQLSSLHVCVTVGLALSEDWNFNRNLKCRTYTITQACKLLGCLIDARHHIMLCMYYYAITAPKLIKTLELPNTTTQAYAICQCFATKVLKSNKCNPKNETTAEFSMWEQPKYNHQENAQALRTPNSYSSQTPTHWQCAPKPKPESGLVRQWRRSQQHCIHSSYRSLSVSTQQSREQSAP